MQRVWYWIRRRLPQPIRHWLLKRQVNKGIRVLDAMDWHMREAGWTRQERRRYWREFTKRQEIRTSELNRLTIQ